MNELVTMLKFGIQFTLTHPCMVSMYSMFCNTVSDVSSLPKVLAGVYRRSDKFSHNWISRTNRQQQHITGNWIKCLRWYLQSYNFKWLDYP